MKITQSYFRSQDWQLLAGVKSVSGRLGRTVIDSGCSADSGYCADSDCSADSGYCAGSDYSADSGYCADSDCSVDSGYSS